MAFTLAVITVINKLLLIQALKEKLVFTLLNH